MAPGSNDWLDDESLSGEDVLKRFAALHPVPRAQLGARPSTGFRLDTRSESTFRGVIAVRGVRISSEDGNRICS